MNKRIVTTLVALLLSVAVQASQSTSLAPGSYASTTESQLLDVASGDNQPDIFTIAQSCDDSIDPVTGGVVFAAACCKTCRKGKACGDSCISRDKTCRKPKGCACDG